MNALIVTMHVDTFRRTKFLLLFTLTALCLSAATVTLNGNNAFPGMLDMTIDGTHYQVLDYTPDRYASMGQTWTANVVTLSLLPTEGYYSPVDPVRTDAAYLTKYNETSWLYGALLANPTQAAAIQQATYHLFDTSGTYAANTWDTAAALSVSLGYTAPAGTFWIDSPLNAQMKQGFIGYADPVTRTPEPGTAYLFGAGFCALSAVLVARRKQFGVEEEK